MLVLVLESSFILPWGSKQIGPTKDCLFIPVDGLLGILLSKVGVSDFCEECL